MEDDNKKENVEVGISKSDKRKDGPVGRAYGHVEEEKAGRGNDKSNQKHEEESNISKDDIELKEERDPKASEERDNNSESGEEVIGKKAGKDDLPERYRKQEEKVQAPDVNKKEAAKEFDDIQGQKVGRSEFRKNKEDSGSYGRPRYDEKPYKYGRFKDDKVSGVARNKLDKAYDTIGNKKDVSEDNKTSGEPKGEEIAHELPNKGEIKKESNSDSNTKRYSEDDDKEQSGVVGQPDEIGISAGKHKPEMRQVEKKSPTGRYKADPQEESDIILTEGDTGKKQENESEENQNKFESGSENNTPKKVAESMQRNEEIDSKHPLGTKRAVDETAEIPNEKHHSPHDPQHQIGEEDTDNREIKKAKAKDAGSISSTADSKAKEDVSELLEKIKELSKADLTNPENLAALQEALNHKNLVQHSKTKSNEFSV
eukprot:Platyproteum_vivax@DN7115_c0_g1_i1.p1